MTTRPKVISIAGFDPSGGAGILADIKTFEQNKVLGFAVCTSITYQTEDKFLGLEWLSKENIQEQLMPLLEQYTISAIKIGLIRLDILRFVLETIPKEILIVWDPILSASAGFDFKNGLDKESIKEILSRITLLTPNLEEYQKLELKSNHSCNILLKGGHQKEHKNDVLLLKNGQEILIQGKELGPSSAKHGSGCILSSAIASKLSLGKTLEESCIEAKKYIENALESNNGLLAYHT